MRGKAIILILFIVLLTNSIQLHSMLVNFRLKDVWRPIEYILDFDYQYDKDQRFTEEEWVSQYEEFFWVPKWLAE